MLNNYLNANVTKGSAKRITLCHSLAGNKIEYLYISNKNKKVEVTIVEEVPLKEQSPKKIEKGGPSVPKRMKSLKKDVKKRTIVQSWEKQVILITSRVHPGETNASWMIQGLIDTLLNPKDEEKELVNNLKDYFEFYIIPMLNVDGVINGNYRCSLAACDLNRKWQKPSS